jgi:hypothetical protein
MHQDTTDEKSIIASGMTILNVVSKYRHTEAVFKQYDDKAAVCLCCHALFDSLEDLADKYGLDLEQITVDLQAAIEDY